MPSSVCRPGGRTAPDRVSSLESPPLVIPMSPPPTGRVVTDYVVMFPPDDEAEWDAGTQADHQATFDTDYEFAQLLKARGGAVTGGAGLAHSSKARTIKRGPKPKANVLVTEGPFAATVEQISGFFIVTGDDYDAPAEAAQVLTRAHQIVQIRPVEES